MREVLAISIVLNIGDIQVYWPIQNDAISAKIYRISFWTDIRHMADISADIRDEISDISADVVTYLDNYFFA